MLSDLLFVWWFFDIVLMLLAQFDLHPLVELHQLLLMWLQLGEKAAQMFMQLHFTGEFSIDERVLVRHTVHTSVVVQRNITHVSK